jgi:hypothetical protein
MRDAGFAGDDRARGCASGGLNEVVAAARAWEDDGVRSAAICLSNPIAHCLQERARVSFITHRHRRALWNDTR